MADVTLSSKNQMVLPREAREALGVVSGDKIMIFVRDGIVYLMRRPESF